MRCLCAQSERFERRILRVASYSYYGLVLLVYRVTSAPWAGYVPVVQSISAVRAWARVRRELGAWDPAGRVVREVSARQVRTVPFLLVVPVLVFEGVVREDVLAVLACVEFPGTGNPVVNPFSGLEVPGIEGARIDSLPVCRGVEGKISHRLEIFRWTWAGGRSRPTQIGAGTRCGGGRARGGDGYGDSGYCRPQEYCRQLGPHARSAVGWSCPSTDVPHIIVSLVCSGERIRTNGWCHVRAGRGPGMETVRTVCSPAVSPAPATWWAWGGLPRRSH